MKKLFSFLLLLLMVHTSCKQEQKQQYVTNPILAGYYPDPSIVQAGEDYYLTNSTFAHYPGLPIFHSKDLLNWKLIGYALDRPDQFDLEGAGISRGLFAPTISYYKGVYYILCTYVDKLGNFVITAKDPAGPWSNMVPLPQVNGIDPSLYFDEETDKAYVIYNSIPPDDISLYDGHRSIRMYEFDYENLKVKGEEILLVNGGTDLSKKPIWIEGPHIYKRNGWYYLMCAEGGTAYNHTEVVFRSKSVTGPYEPYEKNPILTQKHLDPSRPHPITTTGHADLVQDKQGNWWGVFLGCRPYEGDFYNTGRETFMAPVKWENDWPVFDLGGDEVKYQYPIAAKKDETLEPLNGNYTFKDEFTDAKLNLRYRFLRTVKENWYQLSADNNGSLQIKLRKETISGPSNPSFIGFHQPHLKGHGATSLSFSPKSSNEKAGLLIMQNENYFYFLCKSIENGQEVIQLYKDSSLLKSIPINNAETIDFKIVAENDKYHFYYATQKDKWDLILDNQDGKYLSTEIARGFVGALYAMYATSNGQSTDNTATYHWFEIHNDDDVYKK